MVRQRRPVERDAQSSLIGSMTLGMRTEIFINEGIHESRIAIMENGSLAEIWVERPESERMVGDVYKGQVTAVLPGLQAAFVEIGHDRTTFLQVRDMIEAEVGEMEVSGRARGGRPSNSSRHPPIQKLIRKGEKVLVQITKEPIGTKGARVSTQLSLAGRFLVLVPGGDWVRVSRKISNHHERRYLRELVNRIRAEGHAVIVRTEARGKSEKDFRHDLKHLVRTHERIVKVAKKADAPALLHKELGMTSSVIRDLFNDNIDRVVVDKKDLYHEIVAYLRKVSPKLRKRVQYYRERRPVFDAFGIEAELEKANGRIVWMRKGGSLVFDHAEAGTFIDVNSARYVGSDNQEATNLNINLEAAREIARQIRLRDIGGIIVVDFIDMNEEKNRRRVVDFLTEEAKKDRAKISISPQISDFGLVEMTRQRVRPNLLHTHSEPCPTCQGTGRVTGPDTTVTEIERWLQRSHAISRERRFVLWVHQDVANYLLENREGRLKSIRKATKTRLEIEVDSRLSPQDYRFFSSKRKQDVTAEFRV